MKFDGIIVSRIKIPVPRDINFENIFSVKAVFCYDERIMKLAVVPFIADEISILVNYIFYLRYDCDA